MASSRSLISVLFLGTLLVCVSAGVADVLGTKDPADHAAGSAAEAQAKAAEGAAAAKDSAQSWSELAKEKLNLMAGDTQAKTGETVGAAKDNSAAGAGAAQESAKSYLDLAKEKLNAFSKYVSKSFKSASDL